YEKGKLYELSIIDLKIDPDQPRKSMDIQALEDLAASIKTRGIIQPILFRVTDENTYLIIVAGERRYKAAQLADLLVVPGICVEGNAAEIALVENIQRQDLTCMEEAEALKSLMVAEKYSQDQLAAVIGKPRTTVNDSLSLTRLPQEIRDDCRGDRKISKTRLLEISRKKQQRAMTTAYAKYKEEMQKEQAGGKKRAAAATPVESLRQSLDRTREKLEKTDAANWSEDDRLAVNDSMTRLRDAMETFLTPSGEGSGLA
ncbi:MAG: ParB/RepB/Spo0J family partition protein, partial [Deltaproteobacteria bacterium]|nr:ParB/RepB/Spo0J family partition protein [Deltaproteobacteria bacterium]